MLSARHPDPRHAIHTTHNLQKLTSWLSSATVSMRFLIGSKASNKLWQCSQTVVSWTLGRFGMHSQWHVISYVFLAALGSSDASRDGCMQSVAIIRSCKHVTRTHTETVPDGQRALLRNLGPSDLSVQRLHGLRAHCASSLILLEGN